METLFIFHYFLITLICPDRGYTPVIQLRMFNYELRETRNLITNVQL